MDLRHQLRGDGGNHDFGTAAIDAPGGAGGVAAGHFAGNHVFSTDGSYTVTVKAQNNEGLFATQTFTVTVNEVNPSMDPLAVDSPVNEGSPVDLGEIGFDDLDTRDTHSATVSWGDGTTNVGTVSQAQDREGGTGGSVVFPKHAYNKPGTFTISASVQDQNGHSVTQTTTIDVTKVDLTVDPFTITSPAKEGDTVSAPTIKFHDLTTANTHTATIDWGDGTAAGDGCGDRATVRQHRGRHGRLRQRPRLRR